MKAKHTPIEEWIEDNSDKVISNMEDIMPFRLSDEIEPYVKEAIQIGSKNAITYLGLQGIENPKEWVDKHKSITERLEEYQIEHLIKWVKDDNRHLMFDYVAKNRVLEAENAKLKAEIEEYKTMESLHK